MKDMWVRGIFFKQVLDYIKENRSQASLEVLQIDPDEYHVQERYDFEEFAKLLAKVDIMVTSNGSEFITRIARETMTKEARWKSQFRKLDPKNVLMTTERQRGRHNLADFETTYAGDNTVLIDMSMCTPDKAYQDLWANYYKGRLEGVLMLMGRQGSVKMFKRPNGKYTYEVKWN